MKTLFNNGGVHTLVDDGCPGLKVYDVLLQRVMLKFGAFYDNLVPGKTALELGTETVIRLNQEYGEKYPHWKPKEEAASCNP